MSSIPPTNSSAAASAAAANFVLPAKEMGQADFLKLLVAQLTTQDPTSPMENNDFLAQLVQMSALEQNQTLTKQLGSMREDQKLLYANSLLGREVEVSQGASKDPIHGVATGVSYGKNGPQVAVNGELYDLGAVVSLTENKGVNQYASIA